MRCNDDVFLRLEPTLNLLRSYPPVNLIMGLMVEGSSMRVPRPEDYGMTQQEIFQATKSWTFPVHEYPSNAVPTFAQGNAIVLTRDLAEEVGSLARKPWMTLTADDILLALIVGKFQPFRLIVKVDYEFEGLYTGCHNESLWHFNIHPEHMYDLFHSWHLDFPPCHSIVRFCCG